MSPRPKDPNALRRGPRFIMAIPADELEAAQADAAARKDSDGGPMSLAAHVRDLLKRWRKERRR